MRNVILIVIGGLLAAPLLAGEALSQAGIYSRTSELSAAQLSQRVGAALTENGLAPVFEVDSNAELARYQSWGLVPAPAGSAAQSLSFSSDAYSQRLGALDHRLLAAYPLSVTVVATESGSQVLFPRPTATELPPAAVPIAATLELVLVQSIESALNL